MSLYEESLCKFSNFSAASSITINGSQSADNRMNNNLSPDSMTSDRQNLISSNHQTTTPITPFIAGDDHQYSKIALDNGNYQYLLYSQYKIHDNGYNINNIEYNYDYYSSQYNIIPSPNLYSMHTYSTNGNCHRNNDINTNISTVSKIAKDPESEYGYYYNCNSNSYHTAKSKVAMANYR